MRRSLCALALAGLVLGLTACGGARFTVTFDPNGGSLVSGSLEQKVPAGEMPAFPEVALEGAEFLGWDPPVGPAEADAAYTARWGPAALPEDRVLAAVEESLAQVTAYDSQGKVCGRGPGFFLDGKGTLVTSYRALKGGVAAVVTLADGQTCAVTRVVEAAPAWNVAVLKADVQGNAWLPAGQVENGDTVYAPDWEGGLLQGTVTAVQREMWDAGFFKSTLRAPPESGGGPLVNVYGQAAGVSAGMDGQPGWEAGLALKMDELGREDGPGYLQARLYDGAAPSVAEVRALDRRGRTLAAGSGFFLDGAGTLVTDQTLLRDARAVEAVCFDGTVCPVTAVKGTGAGLAILQTEAQQTVALPLSQTKAAPQETVYVINGARELVSSVAGTMVADTAAQGEGGARLMLGAGTSETFAGGPVVNGYGQAVGIALPLAAENEKDLAVPVSALKGIDQSAPMTVEEYYQSQKPQDESLISQFFGWLGSWFR